MANTQLTRIVAPNINEVDYEAKMQGVFNNINENFAKIASLPFIQGVQGDSYQLVEKPIWTKIKSDKGLDINNAKLTKDGALLLGSIFKTSFSVGLTFSNLKYGDKTNKYLKDLTISINGKTVNPIDFFIDSEGNITNNTLYFYAVINDSGDEEEKQLGQYYYFVDARLKFLGDVYYGTDKSILSSFTDYTGFYQYKPKTDSEPEKYDKINILPSLYYDQYKDDICWKFNGNESGVSAIGVKGMDGKDSSFQIVHVTLDEKQTISNTTSGTVKGIFKFNKTNTEPIWNTNPTDISNLVEGNAIISITDIISNTVYLAYGEIKKEKVNEKDEFVAYWNLDTVIDKLAYGTINSYFYDMRNVDSIPANTPRYIAIPAISSDSDTSSDAHTISNIAAKSRDLKFQYAPDVFTGQDSSQKKLLDDSGDATHKAIFENYNVEIKKGDLDIPSGEIRIGTTDGLGTIKIGKTSGLGTITNTGKNVIINYTTDGDSKASIEVGYVGRQSKGKSIPTVTVNPSLRVSGSLSVTKTASLNGGAIINENATINNNLTVKDHLIFKNNGKNAGATSVNIIRVEEKKYNTDRHLDIRTDGLYLSKGEFGNYKNTQTDANAVCQYIDGHLDVYGKATINNGATINGGVKPDFIQLNACNITEMQNMATGGGTNGYYIIEWKKFIDMSTYYTDANKNLVYGKHGIYVKQNPTTVGSTFTVNIKNAPKYALINLFYKGIITGSKNVRYFKLQINDGEVFSEYKSGSNGYDWEGIIYTSWNGGRRI